MKALLQQLDSNLTVEEIVAQVTPAVSEQCEDTDGDSDDDGLVEEAPVFSHAKVAEMLDECLQWYESQDEATATSILLLKRIKDLASKKKRQKLKQTSLRSFIKS